MDTDINVAAAATIGMLTVRIIINLITILNRPRPFKGQKICHPFKVVKLELPDNWAKGKKTKLQPVYTPDFISPEVEEAIKNATAFEVKLDGQCALVVKNADGSFTIYARLDIKRDEKTGEFKTPPLGAIPGEPKPTDEKADHWPHYVPLETNSSMYKWVKVAFDSAVKSGKLEGINQSFTCEIMGQKINKNNTCDPVTQDAVIVPHGLISIEIPVELRNYDGFLKIFNAFPFIEGIVAYGENDVWKIRRDMFLVDGNRLEWPTKEVNALAQRVALV